MEEDERENESERGGENEGVKVSRKLWRECEEKERKEELRTPVRKRVEGSVQRSKVVHQNDSLVFFFFLRGRTHGFLLSQRFLSLFVTILPRIYFQFHPSLCIRLVSLF